MRNQLFIGVALAALVIPGAAYAQSTGTVDFNEDIVVTARTEKGIGGVQVSDTAKARGVLTSTFIQRSTPGQSILDTINQLPGVSFQNNDPFGSAGGTLTIRGFDASRIALTFDGIPLNDTGNYALYSNQQLDPELIENVNVNYGSTDVDSPSAAASGSTVNYRTRRPYDVFSARMSASAGDDHYFRVFGVVDTGVFTKFGTKAWLSASRATNNWYVNDFGKVSKQQYNGMIYQPIGSSGDFISVAGNWNVNRNNFAGSAPLRTDAAIYSSTLVGGVPTLVTGATRTVGTGSTNRFPVSNSEIPYHVAHCTVATANAGVADAVNTCGTSYDERYNPSNTGSIRINSRFTLAQGLVLTVDPSFQYTKANGGGTVTGREGARTIAGTPYYGFIGGSYYLGRDLNGDGDTLDSVTLLAPSQTQTNRYGVIASLRYDLNDDNTVRVTYSFDRGRHRQTGELGFLQANGVPYDVFPVNNGITDVTGNTVEKRNRLSYATLQQVSGEYRGEFFEKKLTVTAGIRAPFFERQLNQYCFTTAANGNVDCVGSAQVAGYTALNPYSYNATTNVVTGYAPPQSRTYRYNKVLPNIGAVYKFDEHYSVYANYSRGLQVPGTDNLYQAFYYPQSSASANPVPETSDNFDAGLRYASPKLQVEVGPWYTRFTNRLAAAYDPDTQQTFYRNLGRVDKYGIDLDIDWHPIPAILVHGFASYLKSEIKNNVQLGTCTTVTTSNCTAIGQPIYALTAGKRESGSPVYTVGGRVQGTLGPLDLGVNVKRTGRRYIDDQNQPLIQCTVALVNTVCPATGIQYQVYGASTPGYTLVDLDARLKLDFIGLNDKTYFQFNLQNVFNQYYVGGFSGGQTVVTTVPFAQIGLPRTFIATLNVQF
jgi:iron complex outermembrane receptor protein